ncbi:MAG: DNA mismatch repair protein MutS [Promethearchaeota archaeon]
MAFASNSKDKKIETEEWRKLDPNKLTDMMRHWYEIKSKYPDYIIAYRMGDFYESFYDDAKKISRLLGLTLTSRGVGENRCPLAGIPHKAVQHFKNLIKMGETVVIVDQLENPEIAQKEHRIVKRGITQILSPGTVIDENLLDSAVNNYLVSISLLGKTFGIAFIDLSCGDFFVSDYVLPKESFKNEDYSELFSFISRFEPVECILPSYLYKNKSFIEQFKDSMIREIIIKEFADYTYNYENAYQTMLDQFNCKNLDGFGIETLKASICAAGALLKFLSETQNTILSNVTKVKRYNKEEIMFLDSNTQKNLEILKNLADGTEYGSLLYIIDKTVSPMGKRLMKKIIVQPLLDKKKIEERLEVVKIFKEDALLRNDLREFLSQMGDMERIISRINYSRSSNARDLVNLKNSLKILPAIKHILSSLNNATLNKIIQEIHDYSDIIKLIESAIVDNPPITVTEGNIIRKGYNPRVDEMRDILNHGKDWILKYEESEKSKLGISSGFKIGFNRVLGYFIQITNNALKGVKLPDYYQKRQTVKNAIRFETPELKEMEVKILNADETIKDIEYEIFSKIREKVTTKTRNIQEDAYLISILDVLSALGETAALNNYCMPKIATHEKIIIKNGRHPVVEQLNYSEPFIPNDCYCDTEKEQLLVITGPNWSGKSTYLRQVALICLMAQIGSFVPADEAEIGIIDRIFTRIGASDDLSRGRSTFMIEMNETAQILHYCTRKSLVIIDELGRGTSTTDGKSIARAVMEYLHDAHTKTLFSTHFHELIDVNLPKMKNYHFLIHEEGKKLIFLRKLIPGGTDKSYGIHVAMMAGVPEKVTNRAFELVETIYSDENLNGKSMANISKDKQKEATPTKDVSKTEISLYSSSPSTAKKRSKKKKQIQTFLYIPKADELNPPLAPSNQKDDKIYSEIIKLIKKININQITPIDAMKILIELKEKLENI